MNRFRACASVCVVVALCASPAWSSFEGVFVDEVVFIDYAGGLPPGAVLGPPDSLAPDLDGGGITVRFGGTIQDYDYTVAIPPETDLVLAERTRGPDIDPIPTVYIAYNANPTDLDNDGLADGITATAALLGSTFLWQPYWDPEYGTKLIFYDLDQAPGVPFVGITADFLVVIDDAPSGDHDLDAVQVVPEASTMLLFGLGGLVLIRRQQ